MMENMDPKTRVIARRVLRMMRRNATPEQQSYINEFAQKMNLVLDVEKSTTEVRDLARASNRRAGRTPGLRRSFAG